MAKETINLTKTVYNKSQYTKVIDTQFTQLVSPEEEATGEDTLPTVDEFFTFYEQLFFDIPKFGETNSHEFLIKTSEEYIGANNIVNDDIQALIDEITELRQENLDLQQNLFQLSDQSSQALI
jgi:hypothetical protein